MRRACSFLVIFADETIAGKFYTSFCIDRSEAIEQMKEIYANEILDVVLFKWL